MPARTNELALFARELLRNPRDISAAVPSSRALAAAMAREVGPQTGRVIEFGPGTGRITHAILARGVAPGDLTLFEMNPEFSRLLEDRFTGVRVVNAPAQAAAAEAPGVGAVISGLPLLSMPPAIQSEILAAAFAVLRPGAAYVQFTYGRRPPLDDAVRRELRLEVTPGSKVWQNLPPARIYLYRRAGDVCANSQQEAISRL